METRKIFVILLCLCTCCLASCGNDDEGGRKVTDYREYTLTVASKKLPGVVFSGGSDSPAEVYAVKEEGSQQWEQLYGISDFEYESGYEYKIRISRTSYLDHNMGDPAWTEYKLLKILSKEKKESEGLPQNFIVGNNHTLLPIHISYAIEAGQKGVIENDLKNNPLIPYGCSYFFNGNITVWALFDRNGTMSAYGALEKKSVENSGIPDSFRLLPPEGQVSLSMRWTFHEVNKGDGEKRSYFVFLSRDTGSAKNIPWLYEDLTEYYKNKYPEAEVKAVVVRQNFRF